MSDLQGGVEFWTAQNNFKEEKYFVMGKRSRKKNRDKDKKAPRDSDFD